MATEKGNAEDFEQYGTLMGYQKAQKNTDLGGGILGTSRFWKYAFQLFLWNWIGCF